VCNDAILLMKSLNSAYIFSFLFSADLVFFNNRYVPVSTFGSIRNTGFNGFQRITASADLAMVEGKNCFYEVSSHLGMTR